MHPATAARWATVRRHATCGPRPRRLARRPLVIKYLGSKRRLVGVIGAIAEAVDARTAIDLFTGTTRVARELKRRGAHVWAVDSARYSEVLARCYVATDAGAADRVELAGLLARLGDLPGRDGYVTETFCRRSRFFQEHNGRRIDAIRDALDGDLAGSPHRAVLLTSLLEAADRVDSTTGVQMAYLKTWAPRSHRPLELRLPELLTGTGTAVRGEATALAGELPEVDLAYIDPPYNGHSFFSNYHIWETLVAWDRPAHYGTACKRVDCREEATRSPFNRRATFRPALERVVREVRARLVVLSFSDEGWIGLRELAALCAERGAVEVLAFDSARYVGARIGIHGPSGERVGRISRLSNVEYLLLAGEAAEVARAAAAARAVSSPEARAG
jgi:adenine-specific DNA-methyltransferase